MLKWRNFSVDKINYVLRCVTQTTLNCGITNTTIQRWTLGYLCEAHNPFFSLIHTMQYEYNLWLWRHHSRLDCNLGVQTAFEIFGESHLLWQSLSIFGCARRIFGLGNVSENTPPAVTKLNNLNRDHGDISNMKIKMLIGIFHLAVWFKNNFTEIYVFIQNLRTLLGWSLVHKDKVKKESLRMLTSIKKKKKKKW